MINRFVVDANTLISAICWPDSIPAEALKKAFEIGQVYVSDEILKEWTEVIDREKFNTFLIREARLNIFKTIIGRTQITEVNNYVKVCRDPKDDKYLDLAIEINARLIVSGDKELLSLHPFRGIEILTPKQFVDLEF